MNAAPDPPPSARPITVDYAPIAQPLAGVFPAIGMGRGPAALDIVVAAAAIILFHITLIESGVGYAVSEALPSLGLLWINIVTGIFTLGIVAVFLRARGQGVADIGLARTNPKRVALATIVAIAAGYGLVLVTVSTYVAFSEGGITGMIQERSEFFEEIPVLSPVGALAAALFVGFHEEVLFRGFILGRLRSLIRSDALAILVNAGLFGLLHRYQGTIGVVQTATVGLVFATVVTKTRSLWPAIIAHGFLDTVGLMLIPLLRDMIPEVLEQATSAPAA